MVSACASSNLLLPCLIFESFSSPTLARVKLSLIPDIDRESGRGTCSPRVLKMGEDPSPLLPQGCLGREGYQKNGFGFCFFFFFPEVWKCGV